MSFRNHDRQYDLVVFGATGYTGALTAEHITAHLPSNLKWAVAGRSETKLQNVIAECKKLNPNRLQPEIEICNLNGAELNALAKKTFILITVVGPYSQYGEHAFRACAENGTHYFDATGEVPWVAKMLAKYEDAAKASGAMMFPQMGLESAVPDLITWSLVEIIREKLSAKTGDVTLSIHKMSATPSGGTLATVFNLFDQFSLGEIGSAFRPYALSPVPNPRKVPSRDTLVTKLLGVRTIPELGTLTTSVAGTTDTSVVQRSWGLHASLPSRQQKSYGPNFSFVEFYRARSWFHGILVHFSLALLGIVMVTPLRGIARKFVSQPGEGPDKETASKEEMEQRGIAIPDVEPRPDQIAASRAWYKGSMYYLTGILLSEAALTVLEDDVDLPGGVFTASCLGQRYIDRLDGAGFKMETKLIPS
ncbi:saccharopine dehydrogenase [Sodiomyces alkalinus F11]|uniref:Saccharopine dehydrogenase n=1 Tax=Sodiomyces alkalinus (strain CBS 110278 / VKM F-3762 / F11) TaxID=1314773 RepID=A0A3N2Q194_SODAK|nr:saccharopine dehydrogenase [Sodiomyces alkalinus F11]ROT40502.1 saccharopine dehydrogenase [Sodiomyces alkalinus F11]